MEIFKFDKEDITRHIEYELKTLSKFREPLKYVAKGLIKLKNSLVIKSLDKFNLNKVKENEGKNYYWSVFVYGTVTLVVRRYQHHLTIFTKVVKADDSRPRVEYGAFTLNTEFEKFGDKHDEMMDKYYNKPFTDLSVIYKDLVNLLLEKDRGIHWVWNSASLKRPDNVKIELIFSENSIHSIDNFVFCMEELSQIYLELFSETTMVQKLNELQTGECLLNTRYKIGKITTTVKDDYYHAVGLEIIDTLNKNEKRFQDVYSLTRWHFEDIFENKSYLYNGEFYVEGGDFKVGEPVAYKDEEMDNVTLYKETYPKENFIPLNKY